MSMANLPIPYEDTKTAFSMLPAQFSNANDKLKTKQFLSASSASITLLEKFGKVFSPITYDMNGSIAKLTAKYEQDVQDNEYIEDMILKEQEAGEVIATDALMWLRRSLHFLCTFFQAVIDDTLSERCSQDLTTFIKNAYSDTLEEYHGWLGTQLVNVLARFSPNRRHLLYMLAMERSNRESNVVRDMQVYTEKMRACVRRLSQFYKDHNLESYASL